MSAQRLGMVVDTKRCVGCHTCAVTCKIENNIGDGVFWNRTMTVGGDSIDSASGTYPNLSKHYITLACQHCENPACTRVCPVGATYKREEDGVVLQDYDKCIGCRMCIAACPYTGVRNFNWEEPQHSIGYDVGDADAPAHQKHTVEKCMMCAHRLARGEEPACILGCLAKARYFGDFNDPQSEVSKLISSRTYKQLQVEDGTNPSVYFLV
ncbi:MAG: 4Fe-4S dicluster domain-containing protein [Coriobacteriales bacterium]|jgi:molybdopterin-containing oxidoreductase family iron-sulfur binding subunit|nr:4Fe-4S dicluster domain-containing protein [Coriobacteriales bacterium]